MSNKNRKNMKKITVIVMLLTMVATAQAIGNGKGEQGAILPVNTTYLDNVFEGNGWDANWFITLQGGMSAFLGQPVGHGDFFDRTQPMMTIGIGKWFTPTVGGRAVFQGFRFKDSELVARPLQNIHLDFMYNITNHFRDSYELTTRWNIIPYLGVGLIRNKEKSQKPFAFSYGIIAQYRLNERLALSGEIGNTTTWKSFDGNGPYSEVGDRLLQASVGITYTIGKAGFKKVVDAKPYMLQYDILNDYYNKQLEENELLRKKQMRDAMALAEMRKILEIEGLLDKYNLSCDTTVKDRKYPKNDYSGLNSLRARLRGKRWDAGEKAVTDSKEFSPVAWDPNDSTVLSKEQYFQLMADGRIFVGTPVFFFFKLGTTELNEKAQIINVREIAAVIKKYGLHARIVGAADSQTGSSYTNERLSSQRADYIANLLKKQGVEEDRMEKQYRGGINSYIPQHGNRNTCVMLYFK